MAIITAHMGRPPVQSDFVYVSPNIDRDEDMAKNGASPRLAKGMYLVIAVLVVVLFAIVMIGLHVPGD